MADEAVAYRRPETRRKPTCGARAIIAAAQATGDEAIHPGYGFLSGNPEFVEAVEAAGLVFHRPERLGDPGRWGPARERRQGAMGKGRGVPVVGLAFSGGLSQDPSICR